MYIKTNLEKNKHIASKTEKRLKQNQLFKK